MDEFNKNDVKEFYEVDEAKVFEAVEYYPVKEVAKSPNEIKDAPEDNSDNEKKVSEEVRATDRPEVDELRERIRSLNSDGSHGTPVTGGETTAAATTGGAASSTGATVVASSASLAGVTIVAVAAVAVIGSNVFNEPPKIASETITLGADYCLCEFELDRSTIKSNTEYSIILTDGVDTFKKDIDLSKSSQRLLFTGLKNDWSYRRQIVAKYNKAEVYYYDLSRIRTDNPKEPVAIFEFDVDIDTNEIDGTNTYNLDYSIYFSNKYGDVTNSYGEIIFNGSDAERKESIVNEEIDNNNFIKGRLENLKDNQELEFNAYSMYKDEMVLIGYEEFNVIYPDYFKTTPEYNSQYVFNSDSISNYTYDINSGSSFVINTGFDNSDDENDALKFDVYDVDNNLIDSVITQDSEITFDMDPMYNSGTIEMTPIKFKSSSSKNNTKALRKLRDDEEYYEYDKEAVIVPYSFDPVFEESSFEIYDDYFVFNGFYSKEDLDENNASFNLNITINYNDGTESKTINETINELMISHEGQYGDNKTKADIASIELLVSHENTNGKNIGLLRFVKDFSVDSVEFSDPVYNEYLGLPYEVTLEKGSELSSIHVEFESGMIEGTNLEDQIGVMEMFEITSPIVKGTFELYYVDRHGVYVQNTLPFDLKVLTSRLFNNILFTPNDNNFDFSFDYAGMTDLGDNYEVVIKTLDSDGNVINTYEDEFKSENESYEINRDLESNCNSVEVSISYINSTGGEAVIEPIETYNFILDAISATSDSVDLEIDDDGNVLIPYSVKEVEGYDLAYLTASFYDGTSEEIQVTDYEGYITITSLNANLLDGKLVATYKSKTTNDYMNIGYKYNMNLNSVINMDYFVPYSGSNQSVAVKYDVLINNKSVNMDLGLTALKRVGTGTDETIETVSINEARPSELDQKYLDILDEYYVVSLVDSSNTLIITANGFDDAIYNSIKTSSFTTVMSPDQVYSDFDNFNINESFSYNVINNDDGTTSYLFNTGFEEGEETTITHKQKFTFVYEDELGNKKSIVKYLDDNSDKTPKITLPTREYEIYYSIEALIDGIPYDVSKDKTSGFKEVDIDPSLVIVKDSGSIDINDNNLIIDYSFNLDCIDTDKSVYLLLNDNEYEIIYYDKTNSNVTIVSDTEYNYFY